MKNIKISFRPKQTHLDEIAKWIIDDIRISYEESGSWDSISESYKKKTLVIATYKNKVVGFYCYSLIDTLIYIELAAVHPDFRKRGIARLLLSEIVKKYEENLNAFYLYCSPESSQKIWKKLGFKYYPISASSDKAPKRLYMYKILKPFLKPIRRNTNLKDERIEVWNDEPYRCRDKEPTWIWNLSFIKNTRILKKPILHFIEPDWQIKWYRGNKEITNCQIKYFLNLETNFFLLIKEIPI